MVKPMIHFDWKIRARAPSTMQAPSTVFAILDRTLAALARVGIASPRLDEHVLLDAAERKTGLIDFGHANFCEGLRALLDSARRDVAFHAFGRLSFYQFVVNMLSNRLLVRQAHKSLSGNVVPLNPPIIITGLARSGTTFLHRLLGQDPNSRVLRLWELLQPASAANGAGFHRLQTDLQLRLMARIAPELDRKHYVRADTPEECLILLASSFVSLIYFAMAPLYSYADWYFQQDLAIPYQEYLLQLAILQRSTPNRRLVLKAPDHLGALAVLKALLPAAMIVQTHRDPLDCLHSVNSLQLSLYGLMVREVDAARMAKANLQQLAREMARNIAYHAAGPNNTCHISYQDLARDPMGCVQTIYEQFGLPLSDAFEANIHGYVRQNPRGAGGVHHYQKERFGLRDEEILEQFAPYREHFGQYL